MENFLNTKIIREQVSRTRERKLNYQKNIDELLGGSEQGWIHAHFHYQK